MKIILSLTLVFLITTTQAQLQTVKTEGGTISGLQQDGVTVFKGVPFAAPPVGDLRWKAPHPVQKWSGIRTC